MTCEFLQLDASRHQSLCVCAYNVISHCVCLCLQVSQYTFAMCSYRERKADPTEIQQLDGFTVDYCEQSLMEGLLSAALTLYNPVSFIRLHFEVFNAIQA